MPEMKKNIHMLQQGPVQVACPKAGVSGDDNLSAGSFFNLLCEFSTFSFEPLRKLKTNSFCSQILLSH